MALSMFWSRKETEIITLESNWSLESLKENESVETSTPPVT